MKIRIKIQIFVVVVLSLALLTACSSLPKPVRGVRRQLEEPYMTCAKQAIKICDQYLSFEISKTEARALAEDLEERIGGLDMDNVPDGYSLLHLQLCGLYIDFSQFLDTTDAEIMSNRDIIKFYVEDIPGYHIYADDYADDIAAIGFSPEDVYNFIPVGYKYDETYTSINNRIVFDMAAGCNTQRISKNIRSYLSNSGFDPLIADVSSNMQDVCYASFSHVSAGVNAIYRVNAADGKHVYLFGDYDDAVVDAYRDGAAEVKVYQDALTPDQAADFFLACLPE